MALWTRSRNALTLLMSSLVNVAQPLLAVAEAVQRLRATGVKYNFGPDPARRDVYLRHLRDWVALLDDDVRVVCECHGGSIGGDLPAMAAELLTELGAERYQATVHLGSDGGTLESWFKHLGPRIRHVHAGNHATKGRQFLDERLRMMFSHGFAGSFTVEFTHGIAPGSPPVDTAILYENALADLRALQEALSELAPANWRTAPSASSCEPPTTARDTTL